MIGYAKNCLVILNVNSRHISQKWTQDKLAIKTHILKFSTMEVTAMNKAMELTDQKFFKNS